jgi:rod shape-determining protein MreD
MSLNRRQAELFLLVLGAFIINAALGVDIRVGPARPNLAVTAMLVGAQFGGPNSGAALGFVTGLLESSYTAGYVGSFLFTRTLAGYSIGALEERVYTENVLVTVAIVALGTAFIQASFYVVAPQPHMELYFTRALWQSAYNSILAIPLFFVFRRMVRKKKTALGRI